MGLSYLLPCRLGFLPPSLPRVEETHAARPPCAPGRSFPSHPVRRRNDASAFFTLCRFSRSSLAPSTSSSPSSTLSSRSSPPQKEATGGRSCGFTPPRDSAG